MSANELPIDISAYGSYARGSALADFLEVVALTSGEARKVDLEATIRKAGWYRLNRGMFTRDPGIEPTESVEDEEGLEDPDDPDWPDWTFAIIAERIDVLGDNYPFLVESDSLIPKDGASASAYVRLLALTVAHAYKAQIRSDPRRAFELIVVEALAAIGLRAYGMGTATSNGRAFATELVAATAAVGLTAASPPVPAKTFAKDAGVDAIGVYNWEDRRPGQVVLIAQATLAESERWEAKIAEPRPHHWVQYVNEILHPLAALAVPHHVEREHLRWLTSPTAFVFDRLRLVPLISHETQDDAEAVDWLLGRDARVVR